MCVYLLFTHARMHTRVDSWDGPLQFKILAMPLFQWKVRSAGDGHNVLPDE